MENLSPDVKTVKTNKTILILILGSLMTVTPFAIDMYLPAFDLIATDFHTTAARVSFSITSYFFGFAIGQLLYGPLLDRFGRKKPLYFGLSVYIVACIGCMQSHNVETLVVFRFIQAVGGCVAGVAATAMVRDFFPVKESAKIFSLLMLILGLSPLLAPTAGGFIAAGLGWQWVFIVLSIIVILIIIIVFFFLPEGHKPDHSVSLKPGPILNSFFSVLKERQFIVYAVSGALSFSTLLVYVAGSPVIFMGVFHVSPQLYGGIFALLSVGFIGSNQGNVLMLKKYRSDQLFKVGLIAQLIVNIIFFIGALNHWYGLVATIILLFLSLSSIGFTYPNASALSLAPFTKNVGSASALLGFLQIGVGGLISSSVGLFNAKNMGPLIGIMMCGSLLALVVLLMGRVKAKL